MGCSGGREESEPAILLTKRSTRCYEPLALPGLTRPASIPHMKLPAFEYACPATLSEAVALLASHDGDAKAIAGGQSLGPMLAFRVASPSLLVDLRKLPGLDQIKVTDAGVRPGALVRWRAILDDPRPRHARP